MLIPRAHKGECGRRGRGRIEGAKRRNVYLIQVRAIRDWGLIHYRNWTSHPEKGCTKGVLDLPTIIQLRMQDPQRVAYLVPDYRERELVKSDSHRKCPLYHDVR